MLPAAPQFPNQEPPRAQQLSLPDLLMVTHVRHSDVMAVAVIAAVCVENNTEQNRNTLPKPLPCVNKHVSILDLHLQASTPSSQLWSKFLPPALPQFLYQLPLGAQQLARPDFLKVPQRGHIIIANANPGVECDVVNDVLATSHRASHL